MNTPYLITSTIIFGLLFLVWTKKTWPNFFIKVIMLAMFIWSLFLTLQALGYIVARP